MSIFRIAYITVIAMLVYLFCIMISLRAQIQPEQSGERDVAVPVASEITSPMPRDEEPAVRTSEAESPLDELEEDFDLADNAIPDIAGHWKLDDDEAVRITIEPTPKDGFEVVGPEFEMRWTEPEKAGRPPVRLNWNSEAKNFVATAPWPLDASAQGTGTYTVAFGPNESTLLVDVTLDEKAQAHHEKIAAQLKDRGKSQEEIDKQLHMTWVRYLAKYPTYQTNAEEAPAAMPDITGTWQLSEYQDRFAEVRKLQDDGADFELHWPNSTRDRPSLKLKWVPPESKFEGVAPWPLEPWAKGNAVYVIKVNDNFPGGRVRYETQITLGEEAREHYDEIVAKLKAQGATLRQIQELLNPDWGKIERDVDVRIGATDITAPPPTPKQVESQNLLIVETEDGIAGYSKTLGTWDRVQIAGEERLRYATVSQNFASVIIGDQLYGFSSESGKWGEMTIPKEHAVTGGPTHSENLLSIVLGDTTYVFSPQKAKWTFPGGDKDVLAPSIPTPAEKFEAATTEMPDISGTWQMPEYGNKFAEIQKVPEDRSDVDYIVVTKFNDVTHWLRLHWNPDKGYFEGQSTWPLDSRAKGTATYVIKLNDDLPILEVDITLDEKAQQDFKVIAAKLAADRKSRGEDLKTGAIQWEIPIEDVLLHPQWHRTVSPELMQLFKNDSLGPPRYANGPDGAVEPDGVDVPVHSKPLATPEMQRFQAFIAALEKRSAKTASEIRAIVKKKITAEPVDKAKLAELRDNLKITLTEALDLKLKLEAQQIEHLESRLTRLKGLMDQRKSLRDQIIDRRMHELLDTDATKWDVDVAKGEAKSARAKTAPDGITIERAPTRPAESESIVKTDVSALDDETISVLQICRQLINARKDVKSVMRRIEMLVDDGKAEEYKGRSPELRVAKERLQLATDEHATVVRDVELQIESAQRQLATAEEAAKHAESVLAAGGSKDIGPEDVAEVKLRRDQIELTLKRLQNRLEYLKKAGAEDEGNRDAAEVNREAPVEAKKPVASSVDESKEYQFVDYTADLIVASRELSIAKKELNRNKMLAKSQSIPTTVIEQLTSKYGETYKKYLQIETAFSAEFNAAQLELDLARLDSKKAQQDLKNAQTKLNAGETSADALEAASLKRELAELKVKRLEDRMAYMKKAKSMAEVTSSAAEAMPPLESLDVSDTSEVKSEVENQPAEIAAP